MQQAKNIYAERMNRLGVEGAFEVLAQAKAMEREGKSIVHLEIGEPDFDTPANIKEAAMRALRDGHTHYSPSAGIPELREAVAEYISKTRNIPVSWDEVVVTPGGKAIVFFTIMCCIEPGDEVIYPNPAYPTYESVINFVGGKAVPVPLWEEDDFRFRIDALERLISPRTKMMIINSPHNPTGGILTKEDLAAIARLAQKHDILVFTDEIYSRIFYEGQFHSILSLPGMKERTILLDGFSKTYAMTGWRLGYGVMPKDMAVKIGKLMNNSNACTATFIQHAGIEALRGPQNEPEAMIAEFKKRREVIVEGLNRIPGWSCRKPAGAFYAFPNIKATEFSSQELANRLLHEAGVSALSGTAFGEYGEGHIRFSYANSIDNIKEALRRIEKFMERCH